ncbi:hypothetical protein Dimus_026622, partial [Dionaea muscipula]
MAQCDRNTSFFHAILKSHTTRRHISSILDSNGSEILGHGKVAEEFIQYYKLLLGSSTSVGGFDGDMISRGKLVTEEDAYQLLLL